MTKYTNEQLAAMTQDQLMGIILQSQSTSTDPAAETIAMATETVQNATTETIAETTTTADDQVKAQIAKLESTLATLKEQGEELYADEIASIKQKIANLKAKLVTDVQEAESDVTSWFNRNRTIVYVVAAIVIVHIAGKLGM